MSPPLFLRHLQPRLPSGIRRIGPRTLIGIAHDQLSLAQVNKSTTTADQATDV